MILRSLLLIAALLPYALASVQVTSPAPGDSISGLNIDIEWEENGEDPPLEELATYQIFLCAGGNDDSNYIQLYTIEDAGDFADGSSVRVSLTAGLGADEENAYFLKFISAATGGTIVNFSGRFSLTSMTGTFPASVRQGLRTVTGTAGPPDQNNIVAGGVQAGDQPAPPATAGPEFEVPYTLQTGEIRYAPMPQRAVSKITAKAASRQFPTSAYTPYGPGAAPPVATTTMTAAITYNTVMREATVAAAAPPADAAMQRFLNRWKD